MATFKVIHRKGNYRDAESYSDVVGYCTCPQKTTSGYICGRAVSTKNPAYEMEALSEIYGENKGTRLRHMVLGFSAEENISPAEAYQIVDEAMDFYADRFQILSAVHEDTAFIHIHFVMNRISYRDGSRYDGSKKDFYSFLSHLRKALGRHDVVLNVVK